MQEIEQQVHGERPGFPAKVDLHVADSAGKADLGKRFVALLIDTVVAMVLSVIPMVGVVLGSAYWVVRDGLEFDFMDRRSLGKKLMKLRPVRVDGRAMDIKTSLQRNWMYGLGVVGVIPVIGWILLFPIGLAALCIGVYEIIKVFTDEKGRRLGDTIAKTVVIEVAD